MSGRHRRQTHGDHRIPQQQASRPVGIVDAHTHVEHLVPAEVLAAHRLSYLTQCGTVILAASLTEPGRGQCRECTR